MSLRWPLRIVGLIGIVFLLQSMWSISLVSFKPLPVNREMPKFSDVAKKIDPNYDPNQVYRNGVWSGFGWIRHGCTAQNMREFAGSIATFYENAVGNARRAGVARIEDAPGWSKEDQKIDNYVAALAEARVLRPEYFLERALRPGSRIPLNPQGPVSQVFPDWAEPPLTLGCPRG